MFKFPLFRAAIFWRQSKLNLDHVAIGLIFYTISRHVRNARFSEFLIEEGRWAGGVLWWVDFL